VTVCALCGHAHDPEEVVQVTFDGEVACFPACRGSE